VGAEAPVVLVMPRVPGEVRPCRCAV